MTIRRLEDNYSFIGIAIPEEERKQTAYCEKCYEVGILSRLDRRIYLDDEGKLLPDEPDADNFRQCWTCGYIIPTREVQQQGRIS